MILRIAGLKKRHVWEGHKPAPSRVTKLKTLASSIKREDRKKRAGK